MKADLSDFRTAQTAVVNGRVVLSLFGRGFDYTTPLTRDDCLCIKALMNDALDDIEEAREAGGRVGVVGVAAEIFVGAQS